MSRRVSFVVLLVALVVGALVVEQADDDRAPVVAVGIDASVFPIAPRAQAPSSTYFCAGGTANAEAFADHAVAILNPTGTPVVVTVTAVAGPLAAPAATAAADGLNPATASDDGGGEDEPFTESVTRSVEVQPLGRVKVRLAELVTGPVASALVEAPAGGLIVEHQVSSIHGFDAKPCSTSASNEWHFAWGTTQRAARELLVLFNPFPDDAIVDGRFSTEDGVREPVRFDGLVVPGRSTLGLDLGDDVTRRAEVAASITTRTGRIVVDRIVRLNGEDGADRGLTVQLGTPAAQRAWVFPDGFTSEEVTERFVVYNPSAEVAEVAIDFLLDRPDENGLVEPVDLSLAPGTHATVDLAADGRVPAGVAHAAVVRSANDVPVVAERVIASRGDGRRGMTVTTGSPVESEEWTFAMGAANATNDQWLTILNLDPRVLAEVSIFAIADGQLVPVSELQSLVVEAGERRAIRLGEHIQRSLLPILVQSTEPIVVERGLYKVGDGQRGMSSAIGLPSVVGLRVPDASLEGDIDADLGDLDLEIDAELDDIPVAPDDVELPPPATAGSGDGAPAGDGAGDGTGAGDGAGTGEEPPGGVPDTVPDEGG